MRESIDRYDALAAVTGAGIVHCCGVDSVPSDLGVLLLHQAAAADGAGGLADTTLLVKAFKGGFSGGTLAAMKVQLEEVRANPGSRALVDDPYALSPDRAAEPEMSDESDLAWIRHDDDLDVWVGPFVMAGVNTRVAAGAVKAAAAGIGLLTFRAGLSYRPTKALLIACYPRQVPAPARGHDKGVPFRWRCTPIRRVARITASWSQPRASRAIRFHP